QDRIRRRIVPATGAVGCGWLQDPMTTAVSLSELASYNAIYSVGWKSTSLPAHRGSSPHGSPAKSRIESGGSTSTQQTRQHRYRHEAYCLSTTHSISSIVPRALGPARSALSGEHYLPSNSSVTRCSRSGRQHCAVEDPRRHA